MFIHSESASRRLATVLVVFYWLALVIATHLPGQQVPHQLDPVDKFLHITAYAGLSFLALFAFRPFGASKVFMVGLVALLAVHGIIDEVTQGLIPGRYPSALDAMADATGAVVGVGLFIAVQPLVRRLRMVSAQRNDSNGHGFRR